MHYLSSVYSVTIYLHVYGLLVAHHQEVIMCICVSWYVLYVLVDCRRVGLELNMCSSIPTRPADIQLKRTTGINCCIYTFLPPDDG
jgi:hypothetical protein